MAAVRAWAAAQGARELTLTTYDDVAWNRAFYERNGFEVIAADSIRPGLAERMREEGELGSNVARVAMLCSLAADKGDPA